MNHIMILMIEFFNENFKEKMQEELRQKSLYYTNLSKIIEQRMDYLKSLVGGSAYAPEYLENEILLCEVQMIDNEFLHKKELSDIKEKWVKMRTERKIFTSDEILSRLNQNRADAERFRQEEIFQRPPVETTACYDNSSEYVTIAQPLDIPGYSGVTGYSPYYNSLLEEEPVHHERTCGTDEFHH